MSMTVSYYSFSPKRADEKWTRPEGIEKFAELKRIYNLNSKEIDEEIREELIGELMLADQEIGGVSELRMDNSLFDEESWLEFYCLEALVKAYNLVTEDEVPTKDEWIRLYSALEGVKIEQAINFLAEEANLQISEAKEYLVSYLSEVRQVVADLKQTQDAVFIRDYQDGNIAPENSVQILKERAEKLIEALLK